MSDFGSSPLVAGTEWSGDSQGKGGMRRSWRWDDLRKLIEHPVRLGTRDPVAQQVGGVPFWSFSYFANDKLSEKGRERTHAVVFQYEPDENDPLDTLRSVWGAWSFLAYPSVARRHRWIVILPLATPVEDDAVFERLVRWVVLRNRFEGKGVLTEDGLRRSTVGACRMPADAGGRDGAPPYRFHTAESGELLSVETCLADLSRLEALAALQDWSVLESAALLSRHAHPESGQTLFAWPGVAEVPTRARPSNENVDQLIGSAAPNREQVWGRLAGLVGLPRPDQLMLLVGRTGCGKSSWALQVAEAIARQGHPTLLVSSEMGVDELVARLFAQRASQTDGEPPVSWQDLMVGAASVKGLMKAAETLQAECPLLSLWAPVRAERTAEAFASAVRKLVRAYGRAPFVVLDDMERFLPPGATEGDREQLSAALRDLCHVQSDWPGAGVLVVSNPRSDRLAVLHSTQSLQQALGEPETRALAEDLVGAIAVDATLVLALATDVASKQASHQSVLGIFKDRAGGGQGASIALRFQSEIGIFQEV